MFYLRLVSFVCTLASLQLLSPSLSHAQIPEDCNVLFIICDDLNDFEGVFGGHPQAQTPHMDALAASGVTFINAHSNAPICGPSRSSFVTGIYPHTSNNYAFENWYNPGRSGWFQNPILQNSKTIMHYMRDNGYQSYGTGKIMHHDLADNYVYPAGHPEAGQLQTDWDEYGAKAHYGPMAYDPGSGAVVNHPKVPQSFFEGAGSLNSLFGSLADVPTINGYTGWWETGWGNNPFHYVNDNNRDDMQDELVRKWAVNKLTAIGPNEKFFMMVGFHNPHTPLVAPQSYFDLYPLESLQLPARIENDIADTYFRNNAKPDTSTLKVYRSMLNSVGEVTADGTVYATEEALLKEYLQAYLACVSFVDAQIGALIDALDTSSHAANTIVVLTSDHGYEFGEKEALSKNTLWENSTRVPLVIRVPGLASSAGQQVDEPVGLIDLFPTIRDLCGLTSDTKKNAQGADLDGHSLRPLLENPIAGLWQGPDVALSMVSTENSDDRLSKNFAVRSKDWRYIRYANGQEELYDLVNDPYEFMNLIDSSDADVLAQKGFLTNALFDLVPDLATAGRNKIVDPGFEWFTEASEPNPIPTAATTSTTSTTSTTTSGGTGVLAGWHSFNGSTSSDSPDEAVGGISTTLSGGTEETVGRNIGDNSSYGNSAYTFTPAADSRGITINTYNTSNKRVDLTITNTTGHSVDVDAIVFDAQLTFNTGTITVSHLSGSSDLNDAFTGRTLAVVSIAANVWDVYQETVLTDAMADQTLANGESAAFRIECAGTGTGALIAKLDNIAVIGTHGSTVPPVPPVTENRAVDPVWFTSEASSNLWQITRENSLQRSGNYALRFQQRWTSSPVIQLLEDRLNSNLTYALSFWLRRGNNDISPLGSNDTTVDIELWSSATADGTFTYRADLITAAQNSAANIWQRFEGSLDAAALAAYDGDYLQLRIVRNDNVKHTIYLDDLVLNAYQAGSFEQWAHDNGLNPSAIAHDLDVDQHTNFVEYALGGNPADPTSGPHEVSIEASETAVNFIYPRRKNSTANYMVETTTDLNATWVEGGAIELPVTESFDADFDKVVNRISGDAAKRFARLKVQSQ